MPRFPKCTIYDVKHCNLPPEERTKSHLQRYHSSQPAYFTSPYTGKKIMVHRDPSQGNYYPCPHKDCEHTSILSSDPQSHHKICPHYKRQYQTVPSAPSSSSSSVNPAGNMHGQDTVTKTEIVEEQQDARDTPDESADATPAIATPDIADRVPEQDIDLAEAFRSIDKRLVSIEESLQGMQGAQRVLQDTLSTNRQILQVLNKSFTRIEALRAAIDSVNARSMVLEDANENMVANMDRIESKIDDIREVLNDHDKNLCNLTDVVQGVSASNDDEYRYQRDRKRFHTTW